MNRKKLKSLPLQGLIETDIPAQSEIIDKRPYGQYVRHITNITYTAQVIDETLIVDFFGKEKFLARLFLDRSDFFSLTYEGKISSAMLDNLKSLHNISGYCKAFFSIKDAASVIDRYFTNLYPENIRIYGGFPPDLEKIIRYQRTLRKRALDERHRRIKAAIDRNMLEIRPVKKDFEKWVYKNVTDHYLIYYSGRKTGICSCCGKEISPERISHGSDCICPSCGTKLHMLRSGAFRGAGIKRSRLDSAWYIQKVSDGIVMRLFNVMGQLKKESGFAVDCKPGRINYEWCLDVQISEIGRYFINGYGTYTNGYEYGKFMQTEEYRWCRGNTYSAATAPIFPAGEDILKKVYPEIKYIPIGDIIKGGKYNPFSLLGRCSEYPQIEYLWKMGMKKITYDILNDQQYKIKKILNNEAKKPADFFGVSGAELKELVSLDPTLDDLNIYKQVKKYKIDLTLAQVRSTAKEYGISIDKLIRCLKYQSAEKFKRYISEQTALHGDGEDVRRNITQDYADYISEAENAGYNMKDTAIINPHDLEAAHNDAEIENRIAGYVRQGEKYAVMLEKKAASLSRLAYEKDGYTIRPIETFNALIDESRLMHHCVGSYAASYAEGKCVILTIRRTDMPETACATVELSEDMKRVRQIRGFRNTTPGDEVLHFCNEWLNQIPVIMNEKK